MAARQTRRARVFSTVAVGALAVTLSGCGGQVPGQSSAQPTAAATTQPVSPSSTPSPSLTLTPVVPETSASVAPAQPPTSTQTQPPTQPPVPTQTPTEPSAPTQTPAPTPTRTNLQLGDRGDRVLEVQQRLSDLGYWLGKPDGHFGGLTQQAVFAYQKAAGLGRDGVVGPKTLAALEKGIQPGSRAGGTGVEIDLDRQLLLIVRDGSVVRVLNTSTGNGQPYVSRGTEKIARTPTGSFAVYRSVDATEEGELGVLYRPKYFYGGYAVHGSSSIPPWPASHGCARVSNAAMNMLWDSGYLSTGTRVTVYR